jgi:CHAT domain-containing protein
MENAPLVEQLLNAAPDERARYLLPLREDIRSASALAAALKESYDDAYARNQTRSAAAIEAIGALAATIDDPVVRGYAAWATGLAAMDGGRLPAATEHLSAAEADFEAAGLPDRVLAVQVNQLATLAMQGRFEEALAVGLAARTRADSAGDALTAGKIEQNLGNIEFVRHRYRDAEILYRQARTRYELLGDERQLAQIDNCLATTLTSQHRFAEAEATYADALRRAEAANLDMTLAEIECNVGCLALYQGRYDRALDYLERSRRRYAQLEMPHERAIADQELADAYLELNMAAEASAIYARVAPIFAELEMPVERARALAYHGRACILLDRPEQATELLEAARQLYAEAEMPVGEAIVRLTMAQLLVQTDDLDAAATILAAVAPIFAAAHAEGWRLQANWLAGVVERRRGDRATARQLLNETMYAAESVMATQIAQRCASELGLVALAGGDLPLAEFYFRKAIDLLESMRAPLPAEEFRMGFIGDKLTPYIEMVRLCLASGTPERLAEALSYVERSRARALVDLLGASEPMRAPRDEFEAKLLADLERLRSELNWFYSQLNRPDAAAVERGADSADALHELARNHEAAIQTILRQLQQRSDGAALDSVAQNGDVLDLLALQRALGDDVALVEYFAIDDHLLAFVVTGNALAMVDLNCTEADVQTALQQFHFQLGAVRHASALLQRHLPLLLQRIQRPLAQLYDLLLRPLQKKIGERQLVAAPYQQLHYVPFHALYDGEQYVIETCEVSVTPSATLLQRCLNTSTPPLRRALLVGLPDDYAPRVADEVVAIAPLFAQSTTLVGEEATRTHLQQFAPSADVVHIACHGRFRSDNPFFSALHLADGWMIVRDAYALRLNCALVALSACETGLSALTPGDDLVGLARGFLLAGAPSLLVSLWMVNDAATAELMTHFYRVLLTGAHPAAALRAAQRTLLSTHPHPFFWAPFMLIGRW